MLKIGMVGGAAVTHAKKFSRMFNKPLFKNVRVTHIWDEKKKDALLLAKTCRIENVLDKKEDMLGEVDGVMIPDDCTMKHQRRATPFLKAGLPTFIDKPLSADIREAENIIKLAKKHKAPIMSCSSLRYAKEIEKVKQEKAKIGDIVTGSTICANDLVFYGIHAFEQLYCVIGPGVQSVQNLGSKGKDIVVVQYKDGRKFILSTYKDINPLFQMNLYGTKGFRNINVTGSDYFYSNMLKNFVKMVRTKKEPFPPEETLEIIKVLALGKKSRKNSEKLKL